MNYHEDEAWHRAWHEHYDGDEDGLGFPRAICFILKFYVVIGTIGGAIWLLTK